MPRQKGITLNTTKVVGLGSIAFSLLLLSQTKGLPNAALRLPSLLIWIVIALSVLMIIDDFLKRRKELTTFRSTHDEEPIPPINWTALCLFSCAIPAYITLIPIVGYLIITPIFLIIGLIVSKTLSVTKAIALGMITTVVIWLVFILLLNLPIPLFAWQS